MLHGAVTGSSPPRDGAAGARGERLVTTSALELGNRALHVDGDLVTARSAFAEAFEQAEGAGDAQASARAALGMSGLWVHERRPAVDAAGLEARQRQALSRLDAGSALALRLRIRLAAEADYRAGRSGAIMKLLAEARASGDALAHAEALSLAHHCLLGPENARIRLVLADELLRVGATTSRPSDTAMGLLWRTVDLFLLGARQAERAYVDLVHHDPAQRNAALAFATQAMRVMLTIRAGRLVEAESLAEACAQAGSAAGDTDWMAWHAAQMLTVRWFQGRVAELVDTIATLVNSPTLSALDNSFVAAQAVTCAAAGLGRQAQGALARLTAGNLVDLPPSSSWLAAMAGAVEAAALLDHPAAAAAIYRRLLPYAELPVMASLAITCLGSVQHHLGVACFVMGDMDRAVEHLEAAVAHNLALGHWPATTLSRHRLAQALSTRATAGDARAGTRMAAEAAAEAAELGMRLPDGDACPGRSRPSLAVCTRWGRRWRIELRGRTAVVDDMVGLHHLAALVANPGVEIAAVCLVDPDRTAAVAGPTVQPVLDDEALRQYRARLRELRDRIEDARVSGDADQVAALRSESDWLVHELQAATGLGGRPRQFPDDAERARIAVGKAIRRALDRVSAADAVIGEELRACVETGILCRYRPADAGSRTR